ncbi:MAG: membrane protein insertase YidC [Clostridia bacterium]|nr:membrane protein insertase YidC [Clostridia bacterium]
MFDWLLKGIGTFLAWLDGLTGNYMLVLLIFAFLLEILFLPFGILQQKNSIKQAKLRPKEMAIRKKYAGRNDRVTQQKVATEIQELYKSEGYNQLAGCLPLLLQLPIILILYRVIVQPLSYVVQLGSSTITNIRTFLATSLENDAFKNMQEIGLLTKIKELGIGAFSAESIGEAEFADLSAKIGNFPDFNFLGLNLGETPSLMNFSWLLIIPILTFAVYFASMKLTRKFSYQAPMGTEGQMGCSNKVMDIMMPAMSLFISFSVPAAVGVYWILKSIFGTLKQFILHKVMPIPQFTEEDYKAAEMEMKGKAPETEREYEGTFRSLCDDDDDEPYPTFVDKKGGRYDDENEEKYEGVNEKNTIAEKLDSAPVKDDDK